MTKILIIEDEQPAAKRLKKLVSALDPNIEIIDVIDSVEDAVAWFKNYGMPDLCFFDILVVWNADDTDCHDFRGSRSV